MRSGFEKDWSNGNATFKAHSMQWRLSGLPGLPARRDVHPIRAGTNEHDSSAPTHSRQTMNVLALTIFVGFVLVTLFVLLWVLQAVSPEAFSDREALLPFDGENTGKPKQPADER